MGFRTDLTSLGAIGLGTAVAVAGTGAILFALESAHSDSGACFAVSSVPVVASVPAVAPVAPADADAVTPGGATIVVSERVAVRAACRADLREAALDVRIRARTEADAARARTVELRASAEELRMSAEEIRAEVEALREEVIESGDVSPDRIQAVVEAALRSN